MSVGFSLQKQDIDSHAGSAVVALRDALAYVQRVNARLLALTEGDLVALGYTSGEVALLKSAFFDLNELGDTANGVRAQAATRDFFVFADQLTAFS